MRKLPDLLQETQQVSLETEPTLAVIVPARNEEKAVAACIRSLLAQSYGNLHVIAVDDRSSDATGLILDGLARDDRARLSVLHVTELPEGWMGKTHAMAQAADFAGEQFGAAWLLFTDADVLFHPECLRRTVAMATTREADHLVTLPTAIVETWGEGMILGYLQVIGLWGARLWRASDPRAREAVGVGAFNLLRRSAYDRIGGFAALRLQVLEDLSLARAVKDAGLQQEVVLARGYVRVHWAPGVFGVLHTMTKNLFAVFRFRLPPLVLSGAGLAMLCLGPFACVIWRPTRLAGLAGVLAVAGFYRVAGRYLTPISAWQAVTFPIGAILFVYALLRSAVVTMMQGGVRWRGTFYPLQTLRSTAVKLR